jgi:ribosomal protein S18 acetylase RimI-like enzyme
MELGSDDVVIREARREDAAGIGRVYVDTWRATYDGILPVGFLDKLSVSTQTKSWQRAIRSGDVILVAERSGAGGDERGDNAAGDNGNTIVGFASGGRETDQDEFFRGEIYTLYVHPDAQRRGIGAELLVEMLRALRDLAPVIVWVLADNDGAQRFYEELGGVPVRRGTTTVGGVTLDKIAYAYFDVG